MKKIATIIFLLLTTTLSFAGPIKDYCQELFPSSSNLREICLENAYSTKAILACDQNNRTLSNKSKCISFGKNANIINKCYDLISNPYFKCIEYASSTRKIDYCDRREKTNHNFLKCLRED